MPNQSFGVAIEEDEFEVADFAIGVANAVIEDDGVGAGLCCRDEPQLVVSRTRGIPHDESEAAHEDRQPGDEDCCRDGAGSVRMSLTIQGVIGEKIAECKFAIERGRARRKSERRRRRPSE